MKKNHSKEPINPILQLELVTLGQYLRTLRINQRRTIKDISLRINVDPRTVSKIEKGDSSVSLDVFISYLNILGLSDGLSERTMGDYLSVVKRTRRKKIISNKDLGYE